MKRLFLSFILILPLFTYSKVNDFSETLDKYHYYISKWILNESDAVDRYLSDYNDSKNLSRTKVDISIEFGKNSLSDKTIHNVDFSLNLSLPRLKNRLNLKFEKVNKNENILGKNSEALLSKSSDSKNESYNLALSYSPFKSKDYFFSLDAGVRFDKIFFEPYIGLLSGFKVKRTKKVNSNIKNSLRFYLSGEIKDLILAQYFYKFDNNTIIGWLGSFEYSNKNRYQLISNEIFTMRFNSDKSFYRVGFITNFKLKNFKNPKEGDKELYFKYHNKLLNKKWLYYEITPSINWKREDNFKLSYGLKVKIGATFGAED